MALQLFYIILAVCLLSLCHSQSPSCGGHDCPAGLKCDEYTYFTLAVQDWCNNGNWSIHGLWLSALETPSDTKAFVNLCISHLIRPNYDAGCWPQYCHDPEWTPVSGSLEQEMLTYWNWCDHSINDQQTGWEHEWKRHGIVLLLCPHFQTGSISVTKVVHL